MSRTFFQLLIPVLLLAASCTRPQSALQDRIGEMESTLRNDSSPLPDRAMAEELMGLYLQYANEYKDDTLSPAYLLRTGELCVALGRYDEALTHLAGVMKYKVTPHAAQALFLQGFVCENYLQDLDRAKLLYGRFVQEYPAHPLANDVKTLIRQLGKSPEDLIREFEAQSDSLQLP